MIKKSVLMSSLVFAFASSTAFAHHPAADIVDPEIYAMIDENVADTPHADLTFDDMGGGMTDTTPSTAMTGAEDMADAVDTEAMESIDLLENVDTASISVR